MSNGGELSVLSDRSTQPSFEASLRGYDKRQVDQYVSQAGSEIATLAAEREQAVHHIQDLVARMQRLEAELTELRQRPTRVDRASFRHLGPMVDQILALAEKQAEAITNAAMQAAAEHRAQAEKVVAAATEQAGKLQGENAAAMERAHAQAAQELTQLKADAEREIAERKTAADQKAATLHAEAQQHSTDVRLRAAEEASAHQDQLTVVQQHIQDRQQELVQLQAELDATRQRLAQAHEDRDTADTELTELQQRLGEARQDLTGELNRLEETRHAADTAEQHAREVRARVQREAKRVADLAAAAVMAAAASGPDTGEYPQVVPARTVAAPRPEPDPTTRIEQSA
jgi:chromosome segregation ATPase